MKYPLSKAPMCGFDQYVDSSFDNIREVAAHSESIDKVAENIDRLVDTSEFEDRLNSLEQSVSGNSRFLPWQYNAEGGEQQLEPPYNFTSAHLFINGVRQRAGAMGSYYVDNKVIYLAEPLEEGDWVDVELGTEPRDLVEEDISYHVATVDGESKTIVTWFKQFLSFMKNLGKQLILSKGTTTARSLEDRFSDVLDVKDFGGVEGSDITESVQNMLNEATTGKKCIISVSGTISRTIRVPPINGLKIITLGTISSSVLDYIFESDMQIKTYTRYMSFEGGVYNSKLFLRINDSKQKLLPDSNPNRMGYCGYLSLKNIAISGGYGSDNKPVIHLTKCPQLHINNVSIGSCDRGIVLEGCDLPYLHKTSIAAYRVSGIELITRDAAFGAQGYINFCELLSPRRGGIGIISSDRDVRIEHNYFEPTRDPETDEPAVACIRIKLSEDPYASKMPPKITIAHNRIDGIKNRPNDKQAVTNWLLLDVAPMRSYIINNRSTNGFVGAVKFPAKVSYWYNTVDRRYITANSNNPSDVYPMRYTQQEILPLNEYARYNPNLDGILYNKAQSVDSLAHYVRGGVFVLESNPDFLRVDLTQYGRLPASVNVWVLAKTVGSSAKLTVHYNNGMGTETFTKWNLDSRWKWININNNAALYDSRATLGFSNEDESSGRQADIEIAEVIFTGSAK